MKFYSLLILFIVLTFSNANQCSCPENQYFSEKEEKCRSPTQRIENCLSYSEDFKCLQCKNQYYLSIQNTRCIRAEKIENCKIYLSNNECKECEQNYFKNENGSCSGNPSQNEPNFTENCEKYTSFSNGQAKCLQCKKGYFLEVEEKSCKQCPNNHIQQTEVRSLKETNLEGDDKESCISPDTEIQNCKIHAYNKNSKIFTCDSCEDEYFAAKRDENGNILSCKKCPVSLSSISSEDSQEDSIESDQNCPCGNGTVFNFEEKNCLPPTDRVRNCLEYTKKTTSIGKITYDCNECNGGFYLSSGKCLHAFYMENCLHYKSQNECKDCVWGFYLSDNGKKCVAAPEKNKKGYIKECGRYEDSGVPDQPYCSHCYGGSYLYEKKECKPLYELERNCKEAKKIGKDYKCTGCYQGTYLNADYKCADNPNSPAQGKVVDCLSYELNKDNKVVCATCTDGYTLQVKEGKQVCNKFTGAIDHCEKYSFSGLKGRCSKCEADYFGAKFSGKYISECEECPEKPDRPIFGYRVGFGFLLILITIMSIL